MSLLQKLSGSTDTPQSIHKCIQRGSVVTTWDDTIDHYGKLFFVYDVRPHSRDIPTAGTGLVLTPFRPELKDVITQRFVRYPKDAYPFDKYDAEVYPDVSKFYPTLDATIGDVGQLATQPPDYSVEALIERVESLGNKLPLQNQLATYPSASLIVGALRDFFTFYLHVQHRKAFRIAILPEPEEYRRAFSISPQKDEQLLYVTPESMVEFSKIALYHNGYLLMLLNLKEGWKAGLQKLFEEWNRQKYIQKPTR